MKIAPLMLTRNYNNNKQINNQQSKVNFGNNNYAVVETLSGEGQSLLKKLIAAVPKAEIKQPYLKPFNRFTMTEKEIKRRYPNIDVSVGVEETQKGPVLESKGIAFHDGKNAFFDYGIMTKNSGEIEQIYVKDDKVFSYSPIQNINKKFVDYANIILGNK